MTGLGALCALGAGVEKTWEAIQRGDHGIRPLDRFGGRVPACLAATLPGEWSAPGRWGWEGSDDEPLGAIALAAAREAWAQAGLDTRPVDGKRVAIVFATSGGGMISRSRYELESCSAARRHLLLEQSRPEFCSILVADTLGIEGPRLTVSTACTSSTQAIALASELLACGAADLVLAGGAEVVAAEFVAGFFAMGVIAPAPCAPFSTPIGMTLAEGAGFVVVERREHAAARGAAPICTVCGSGLSADAYHATAPDPGGAGMARALRAALADAALSPEQIGYLNAHGTGTLANDAAECRAIERAFGAHAACLPVSSSKGHFGHARGAAGALELIVTALSLRHQVVPPTLHHVGPRAGACPRDPVTGQHPRPHRFRYAITQNAAFGGTNAAVVIGAADATRPAQPSGATRPIWVIGHSALSAESLSQEAVAKALRTIDTRGMDRVSRLLTAAAAACLEPTGIRWNGALRERAGLVVGAHRLPWDSAAEFWDSIRERGFDKASAPAFSRLVMSAPAGAASRALGLRGPLSVVSFRAGSTLAALALARAMLLRRSDADLFLAGSAFEVSPQLMQDHAFRQSQARADDATAAPVESATCVALCTDAWAVSSGVARRAVILGSAIAGPRQLAIAVRCALQEAQADASEVDVICRASDGTAGARAQQSTALAEAIGARMASLSCLDAAALAGGSEAADGVAIGAAIDAIQGARPAASGQGCACRRALVVASDEACGSVAVILGSPSARDCGATQEQAWDSTGSTRS